jgi:polyisoprenoid-binding protein YceI
MSIEARRPLPFRGFLVHGLVSMLSMAASTAFGETVTYRLGPGDNTTFALEVYKSGFMRGKFHVFQFGKYEGTLAFDADAPEKSTVQLTIQSSSLTCEDTWINDKQMKKVKEVALSTMLAIEEHPEITFSSRTIRTTETGEFEIEGDLTIRDQARPSFVRVEMGNDASGKLTFEGGSVVSLKDYGLKPPSNFMGLIGTENEMAVSFRLLGTPENLTAGAGGPHKAENPR